MSGRWFTRVALLLVFLLPITPALAQTALAQRATSTITGLVRDPSGAPIPGATVLVINERTGARTPILSNPDGVYRATGLAPGDYRLETVLDGFETVERRVVLDADHEVSVDITLTPSKVNEAVVVTARRVEELAQEVPIPVSVVRGDAVDNAGDFNVNRLKEMIPTVQFYSARQCSVSSPGRSPIACACFLACGSTTTRKMSTSTSRSTAACRPAIPR
jgi:hypothetical protein